MGLNLNRRMIETGGRQTNANAVVETMGEPTDMERGATISKDKLYRYSLTRGWNSKRPTLCCLMLNPSIADAYVDDRTIAKVIWYAGSWHYGSVEVVNFCAYRATKPKELFAAMAAGEDVVGPDNIRHLASAVLGRTVLCAWGGNVRRLPGEHVERVENVLRRNAHRLVCLDTLFEGQPVHPLYQLKSARPRPFAL